jgi:hypothetical protein
MAADGVAREHQVHGNRPKRGRCQRYDPACAGQSVGLRLPSDHPAETRRWCANVVRADAFVSRKEDSDAF